jgi:Carboxypeptidase regulatory-like domain/TonB dependent receptor-like, beta-barrel
MTTRLAVGRVECYLFRFSCFVALVLLVVCGQSALAQQTLGSINGTVTDISAAVITGSKVKARATATNLEVSATSASDGSFSIADLPIGEYEVTFTKDGFEKSVHPHILVQGNRTTTINARLHPGSTAESVTVEATPLLNQTDTTTGYILDDNQIADIPLGTGSFTQTAILSPGVNADFLNTAGTNAGLGNQAIWANGQRDTSNSVLVNGVSGNNIFNGKTTSQVTSQRVAVNIGENGNGNNPSGEIVTSTSVYGAVGQALPSPPPETVQELHVNSAMYDASQGAYSGAHIELTTKSGSNAIHGGLYDYYQTSKWNANQWFYGHNGLSRPPMHRETFGGFFGGPLKKDKIFYFASYQGQRAVDQLLSTSLVAVPPDLTSDRSAGTNTPAGGGLAAVVDKDFIGDLQCGTGGTHPACFDPTTISPQALAIMQMKAPDGSLWVPNAATGAQLQSLQGQNADAAVQGGTSSFKADQVNGNIDYYFSTSDRLAAKYYFQNDPNTTPFANSQLLGFPQTLHAGSQVLSLGNTTSLTPNLTWEQRLGFVRETANSVQSQFITPSSIGGINLLGKTIFPSISIHNADGIGLFHSNSIGPASSFADTGMIQNNFEGASSIQSVHGRHTLSTGFSFDYTQLNIINRNDQLATLNFADFPGFLQGQVCSPSFQCSNQPPSELLTGSTSRHYRTKQAGAYVQDKFRLRPNLTLDVGLRWDWDGPLYEKDGLLANFYPQNYSYDVASDTVTNIGLVIAGNNKTFGTKGVSNSTLTGRQWGFAPRIGLAYSPSFVKNVVVRAGFGMYYDRGEYFTELSPPAGGGVSGPFGVTAEEPFVVPFFAVQNATFGVPFGTTPPPPPPTNFSTIKTLVPNAANLINQTTQYCTNNNLTSGCSPFYFGGYDPKATLPYSENWTLDLQWQPKNTLVLTMGYVGNHGVHGTIPLPFNQARIATPQKPLLAGGSFQQNFSYGYNMNCQPLNVNFQPCTQANLQAQTPLLAAENVNALVIGVGAGNAALRAPYIGYDPNSDFNRTVGMSNYDALQFSVNKRLSHGLLVTASYTYSHTLDESSGLGLFYNGNDPNNPRSSYGNSDFDRTHVFTVSYHYQLPTMARAHGWLNQVVNGWGFNGLTVLQSGQPYSVIDFSGGVGSIYWGPGQDQVTNPIVPVRGFLSTQSNPTLQGTTGINGNNPVLNANAFGIPAPFAPGTNGVPPCDPTTNTCDTFENGYASGGRNIFRAPFQNRWDFGIVKDFKISERFALRYDLNLFNIFNHPSFDVPNNNVDFNAFCNPPNQSFSCGGGGNPPNPPLGNPAPGYSVPPIGSLGVLSHTIGSPRFMQMALHLTF